MFPDKDRRCGSILFAVHRGRSSEGFDFRDDAARLVVLVGVPFLALGDPGVVLKKRHDAARRARAQPVAARGGVASAVGGAVSSSRGQPGLHGANGASVSRPAGALSGSAGASSRPPDWYTAQAFLALNQAAGRCLRHARDHGAVVFLDARMTQPRWQSGLSAWMRPALRGEEPWEAVQGEMHRFFAGQGRGRCVVPVGDSTGSALAASSF